MTTDLTNNLKVNLDVWKYPIEGYLRHTYSPLRTLVNEKNKIVDFNINSKDLNISSRNMIFECQPSYDGTVNLIFNDDVNPPRIVNTRFSKKENDTYKIINRIQTKQTNLYNSANIDPQTRLIKNANSFPIIDLLGMVSGGQLKGGNYTLYLKYIDSDFNESPIVCESGQISVFHGHHPSDISAALSNEIVQKTIKLYISNLDTSYNSFKLYCVRNYSDTGGTRLTEAFVFSEPFVFSTDSVEISITGYETTEVIDVNTINIRYQSFDSVKTHTQNQNLLFFGNIERTKTANADLQNCSYFIKVTLKQSDSIGYVSSNYSYKDGKEYYDTNNIYYRLGY